MSKTAVAEREPCGGRGCPQRGECALYASGAAVVHGAMDTTEGWVCEEWTPRHAPIVEVEDDDQGQLW